MDKKQKKQDDLDMETSFADMNVEGMPWYDIFRKNGAKKDKIQVTKKEYWAMVRGAFRAYAPMFLSIICGFGMMILLMYLWLK